LVATDKALPIIDNTSLTDWANCLSSGRTKAAIEAAMEATLATVPKAFSDKFFLFSGKTKAATEAAMEARLATVPKAFSA